ncbi:hypothetical protein [Streptomyces sedi]|uniref:Uncharacterized protein n=1 Tax=Streptomyces sedi TaxID=555059 RepID=A0A5C4URB8_9ACTN|nr:hypothetical protein [Streptomyces sedi]TNM26072.1 hypothetical protein FH715_25225 [Streptomyces sedi]
MAIDPDLCIELPAGFDDSDEDTQVYPVACKLFMGVTASEAFARASRWVAEHDVRVTDVSWDNMLGEDEPHTLSLYFVFELDPEDDEDED